MPRLTEQEQQEILIVLPFQIIGQELRGGHHKSKTGKDSWNPRTITQLLKRAA